jgi:O-methyltransferase involved in polyketide biosynthesis
MSHAEREPLPPRVVAKLGAVASTLLIPLAARAHGDAMFPHAAIGDAHAAHILARLGCDVSHFLADEASVYGVLARTAVFRERAAQFFDLHPGAVGASLGAGLGHYHQWLDNGRNAWIDADLPEVTALRDRLIASAAPRRVNAAFDLTEPGWWARLRLPSGKHQPPVLLICEGVLMYFEPAQVRGVLREIGQHAPAGTRLLCDAMCWLAVGRAKLHASVRHTQAEFRWGPRDWAEFAAAHSRLHLDAEHEVMEGYGWPYAVASSMFRLTTGVPFYGVAEISVGE